MGKTRIDHQEAKGDFCMNITENELLSELTKAAFVPELDEAHEVTINMLIETTGRNKFYCWDYLNKQVKLGKLAKRMVVHDGKNVLAFHDQNKWKPE